MCLYNQRTMTITRCNGCTNASAHLLFSKVTNMEEQVCCIVEIPKLCHFYLNLNIHLQKKLVALYFHA